MPVIASLRYNLGPRPGPLWDAGAETLQPSWHKLASHLLVQEELIRTRDLEPQTRIRVLALSLNSAL